MLPLAAAGMTPTHVENQSPLSTLNWARTSYAQLMARTVTEWGGVVTSNNVPHFKGSNESSTALALKAHLARWVRTNDGDVALEFEYSELRKTTKRSMKQATNRFLRKDDESTFMSEASDAFEVESMRGSGPMESFYHRKIFSRVKQDTRFFLIVPSEAILWAGPYLADLAHHLSETDGRVMIPSTDGTFLEIAGKPLVSHSIERLIPLESVRTRDVGNDHLGTPHSIGGRCRL